MLKRILLGYDGSDESDDALALAGRLAGGTGASVEILSVFPYDGVPPARRREALREDAAPLFAKAQEALTGIETSTRSLSESSAAGALTRTAEAGEADLIVIGSTHRGAIGRVLPGSVGERLLTGAPCAVAVAPRGYGDREHAGIDSIGVGYDGRSESRAALEQARDLAATLGTGLTVIEALYNVGPSSMFGGSPGVTREDVEADLREAAEVLGEGIEAETVIGEGEPAAVLAGAAVELDLIVIGSRGYGPVARTLLGGVSADLIRNSPCPVIVVPRGTGQDSAPSIVGESAGA